MSVLDAFKIKPFDLAPVFVSWSDAPRFLGNPRKDPPVNDWLAQIKAGCIERKVPKDYWHKVGQHYLGEKARKRLDEVKLVMKNMHGGKYKWNWKSFKTAMRNMGWDIDTEKKEAIAVKSRPSGLWWIVGKGDDSKEAEAASPTPPTPPPKPQPKKSKSTSEVVTRSSLPTPKRSATMSSIESVSSIASSVFSSKSPSSKNTPVSTPPMTPDDMTGDVPTTITHAPVWLVNACQALESLTTEHPKAMSALSAVLITVGSLPALPAISAGVGGAFLASSTAHALGSLAVGFGTLLKAQADGQVQTGGPMLPSVPPRT
ncbi:uncharacterized protein C8Q71DRAFT_554406 [Rhodofomes roseus]|uniref:Uncharacterized protein n=1 Tax=Rhodofomes roseus TaxID=34475 RepID=A0ABQ8KIM9_9APHY|nr:uncharacterized protein C8Q71DRAFT_554406 [Rhodofomes roseus]KAH9837645.1 hypothetical protein C8Q71DRAFT_554406 [Rhodofomes roseus]